MREGKANSVVSKSMLVLSFLCPFLLGVSTSEEWSFWLLYAPLWVIGVQKGNLYAGPTLFVFVMFLYWIPYTYVGYEFKRLAEGRLESWFDFALRTLVASVIAIILALPLSTVPTGYGSQGPIYSRYIPLPILSILALVVGWKFKPDRQEEPWKEEESETEANETEPL